ncbi:MAG: TPM domain-containing protein [Bacteroidetes bacterium]|uniref:TPM domain-containing protein n=1 Tax=Candidatus Cryptobacteroides excrementavium TaxID=2840759 RepID=A0A9D9J2P7_9BACT|nr:TPM domain-containing protein [Candidatus Cryptobacteroides excrementavium]
MPGKFSRYCVTALLIMAYTVCNAIPPRPVPPRLVNDFAGIFTAREALHLEQMLTAFDDSTSNQIAVITTTDLEGLTPAEYATRTGLEWGIGSEKYDNGIVVLVKPKTYSSNGQVNISVGYGLEGAIPDAYAKRIIDNEMIPHFAEGDYFGGVAAGCTTLMKLASGEISEPEETGSIGVVLMMLIMCIIAVIFFTAVARSSGRNNRGGNNGTKGGGDILDAIIIGSLLSGGNHRSGSGWGGSGGGFGGFGGFGGGSFGGGGASGSW